MADEFEAIDELRNLVNETEQTPYSDEILNVRLAAAGGDIRAVAADIWTEKAARYAELVDVQEGSSRRSLGDLYEQAIAMAQQFGASAAVAAPYKAGTRAIERP